MLRVDGGILERHRPRVAFVIQRYGLEVIGGAEQHCRMIAEHLQEHADVTVFTTCALDGWRWSNSYPPGGTTVRGVRVQRFPVRLQRNKTIIKLVLAATRIPGARRLAYALRPIADGPFTPALVHHLSIVRKQFDVFVFFCYNFFPTQIGIHTVPDRAILVPVAHDVPRLIEPPAQKVFAAARRILANTPEEADLIRARIYPAPRDISVVGCGVDPPPCVFTGSSNTVPQRPYVLTLARSKPGLEDIRRLIVAFRARYASARFSDDIGRTFEGRELQYLLVGDTSFSRWPSVAGLRTAGPVSELEKWELLRNALVVVNPSLYESLSLVLLEAWTCERPTLVTAGSNVLVGQTARSGGGMCFQDPASFAETLSQLLRSAEARRRLGTHGREWVRQTYDWSVVIGGYKAAIDHVMGNDL